MALTIIGATVAEEIADLVVNFGHGLLHLRPCTCGQGIVAIAYLLISEVTGIAPTLCDFAFLSLGRTPMREIAKIGCRQLPVHV